MCVRVALKEQQTYLKNNKVFVWFLFLFSRDNRKVLGEEKNVEEFSLLFARETRNKTIYELFAKENAFVFLHLVLFLLISFFTV